MPVWLLAAMLLACGRSADDGRGARPKVENGRPYGGVGHGTGEPGTGYGGQTWQDTSRNPPSGGGGAAQGRNPATRPGVGNANAR